MVRKELTAFTETFIVELRDISQEYIYGSEFVSYRKIVTGKIDCVETGSNMGLFNQTGNKNKKEQNEHTQIVPAAETARYWASRASTAERRLSSKTSSRNWP